jgi:hypothetical protein
MGLDSIRYLLLITGGWNPTPKNYVRNSFVTGAIILSITAVAWNISVEKEVEIADDREEYITHIVGFQACFGPRNFMYSILTQDPESVARWKAVLKEQGREWIEPIPKWWPFK